MRPPDGLILLHRMARPHDARAPLRETQKQSKSSPTPQCRPGLAEDQAAAASSFPDVLFEASFQTESCRAHFAFFSDSPRRSRVSPENDENCKVYRLLCSDTVPVAGRGAAGSIKATTGASCCALGCFVAEDLVGFPNVEGHHVEPRTSVGGLAVAGSWQSQSQSRECLAMAESDQRPCSAAPSTIALRDAGNWSHHSQQPFALHGVARSCFYDGRSSATHFNET